MFFMTITRMKTLRWEIVVIDTSPGVAAFQRFRGEVRRVLWNGKHEVIWGCAWASEEAVKRDCEKALVIAQKGGF